MFFITDYDIEFNITSPFSLVNGNPEDIYNKGVNTTIETSYCVGTGCNTGSFQQNSQHSVVSLPVWPFYENRKAKMAYIASSADLLLQSTVLLFLVLVQ